jgi:glycosyltransferase involved in cell wall biosynthesis
MPQRSRLLYLITRGILGGAQAHVRLLALHLRDRYDVQVAVGDQGPLSEQLRQDGIPVHHVPALVRSISPVRDLQCLQQLSALFQQLKPDLVCAHSSKAGIMGRLAARRCHLPAVFTAHGWAFTEGVPATQRACYLMLERLASRWSEKIICVSEFDRQLALKQHVGGEQKLITIHNGMPDVAGDLTAKPGGGGPVRLIMVARFSGQKDYQLLLTAISRLQTRQAFEVELVGDGPLMEQCQQQAARLGVGDRVRFMGSRTDVPALLAGSQIFVLTSNWEGFPISVLEAMRAGLPVIASDVGGTGEAVQDGETGFLIPRGDLETLESRMLRLIEDPELRSRMGSKGRERFTQYFTFELMAQRTEAVYQEILSGRD